MTDATQRIIGGLFGLEEPGPSGDALPFDLGRVLLTANASSALFLIAAALKPRRVWLPSYLCEVLATAIRRSGQEPLYYDVGDRLAGTEAQVLDVRSGDLVVAIHYFGFRNNLASALSDRPDGSWVVEDASQALLTSDVGQVGDFVLYSPRKFVGLPDGGVVVQKRGQHGLGDLQLGDAPDDWWLRAFAATSERLVFDRCGGDRRWFTLFREAERMHPIGPYRMSDVSRRLLAGIDYGAVASQRRTNYALLLSELADLALIPNLPEGVVPLGFPIRISGRDAVRERLFAQEIYPPVHWNIDGFVPPTFGASHTLSREIMTIPCDQRYGAADMERIVGALRGS